METKHRSSDTHEKWEELSKPLKQMVRPIKHVQFANALLWKKILRPDFGFEAWINISDGFILGSGTQE